MSPPPLRTARMLPIACLLLVGVIGPVRAQQDAPEKDRILSFSEFEQMSDQEYWAYIYQGFFEVVEGHPWGMHLRDFLSLNAHLGSVEEIERTSARRDGNAFWVTIHPPSTSGVAYYYRDSLNAIFIPRIPVDPHFAGAIFAHELQHAYDRLMSEDTQEYTRVNNTFIEMQAYVLSRDLLDNYTGGAFRETLRTILGEKEYDVDEGILYRPDKKGRARLEKLFGPPSVWELKLRDVIYDIALSYEASDNPVERSYATALFKGFNYIFGDPKYDHAGQDLAHEAGTPVPSPIEGEVVRHERSTNLDSDWQGIVLQGAGPDSGRTIRVLGLEPSLEVGTGVQRGDTIGIGQHPDRRLKGYADYLHVELYEGEGRKDPVEFLKEVWPDHKGVNPGRSARGNASARKTLMKALEEERDRDYEKAARLFEEAVSEPWSEVANTYILHYLARSQANMGQFDAAVETQEKMVRLVEYELEYAREKLPHPELGTVGSFMEVEILEVYLNHMRANLEAYRRDQQTIYVY